MPPARLAVTLQQDLVVGLQEHELCVNTCASNLLEGFGQRLQVLRAISCIDTDSERRFFFAVRTHFLYDRLQQGSRHIVDTVVTEVFESMQRDRFAGARQTADDNQAHCGAASRLPSRRDSYNSLLDFALRRRERSPSSVMIDVTILIVWQ